MKRLHSIFVQLTCSTVLAIVWACFLMPLGGTSLLNPATALACGIGSTATMIADGKPSLANPTTPATPANAPVGIFPELFIARHAISLTEDLSQIPTPFDPHAYQWSWDFGDGTTGSGLAVNHTYTLPRTYIIRVGIIDPVHSENSDHNFDSSQITIDSHTILNPPKVTITSSPEYAAIGTPVEFIAQGTSADHSPLTFLWNFGDTTTATGAHVSHSFPFPGKGFVAVIAQDANGARTIVTAPIFVVVGLPTAAFTPSSVPAQTGDIVTFDASASHPVSPQIEPGDRIISYLWNFGDGSKRITTKPIIQYAYYQAGSYTVTLQIVDRSGITVAATTEMQIRPGSNGQNWKWIAGGILLLLIINWMLVWPHFHKCRAATKNAP